MKNSNKIKIYRNKFLFLPTYVGCKLKWLTWVTTSELRSIVHNNKEIVWVEHQFLREGVRIQRKQTFNYPLQLNDNLQIINNSLENCFVNGLPNKSIAKKVIPTRNSNHLNEQIQPLENSTDFKYFKIELNNYIGNPN